MIIIYLQFIHSKRENDNIEYSSMRRHAASPIERIRNTTFTMDSNDRSSSDRSKSRSGRPSRKKFDRISYKASSDEDDDIETSTSISTNITITILDSAQNKFSISIPPDASVQDLKRIGHAIHSIPPDKQRLVSMGQLLKDEKSITDHKIANGSIVHLFPKPNVIISNSNDQTADNTPRTPTSPTTGAGENGNGIIGAHVPQIVMDSEEVHRQSSILILSTHEAYETMHRIRLLSFLLLMYSSIQMLRDVSIYLAPPMIDNSNTIIPPGDPTDTSTPGQTDYDQDLPQWQNRDYFEMAICVLGMYVALLGIKSTSEHIGLTYARKFMILLGILGVVWNSYLFFDYFDELRTSETPEDYESGKVLSDTLFALALPVMLWLLFFLRAVQFYNLVKEAETDAEERSRSLASAIVTPGASASVNDSNAQETDEFRGRSSFDLELQAEGGRSIS